MRETGLGFEISQMSSTTLRMLRLAAVALGVGLVMSGGVARAEDDEDDSTFEERIIKGIMAGIGGTNMENTGIEYRERSPLVVPPRIDLPPPATGGDVVAPNWPKDPDAQRRKAAIAAAKKAKQTPQEASRLLTPDELNVGRTAASKRSSDDPMQPGNSNTSPVLSPSQLGYTGGLSGIFGGGSKVESAPFKGEPPRDSLVQPPVGYQTPSPNYAYGTGPKESLVSKPYNPAAGQYGD